MRALRWLLVVPLSPSEQAARAPLLRAAQDWQQARYDSSNARNAIVTRR
ncbi:MAG: hypothetical protein ABI588_00355 [Arenimonas sp.]